MSSMSRRKILTAVERRLDAEPQHVLPTLRLLAGLDPLPDPDDDGTRSLARTLNVHREVALLRELRERSYTTAEVAELLGGVTRQAVSLRVKNNRLLAIEISGRSYFPPWQFVNGRVADGLPDVIDALLADGDDVLVADAVMRKPIPEEAGRNAADLLGAGNVVGAVHYIRAGGF